MGKYKYNLNYFEKIDSEDKAYWLGFLYADGSINRFYAGDKLKSMTLEVGLSAKDRSHLEKFKKSLESDIPIFERTVKSKDKEYNSVRIQLNNTKICNDLCKLGCVPSKTFKIQMPTDDIVPIKYMRDFLRGFFDGDGCISISTMAGNPHIFTNITGISGMLNGISDFLISNKIIRTKPTLVKDTRRSDVYSMLIYGKDTNKEFLDYLYYGSTLYLDRKYNAYKEFYKDYKKSMKRGVYFSNRTGKYIARIGYKGKVKNLGSFSNIDDAIKARKEAEIELLNYKEIN